MPQKKKTAPRKKSKNIRATKDNWPKRSKILIAVGAALLVIGVSFSLLSHAAGNGPTGQIVGKQLANKCLTSASRKDISVQQRAYLVLKTCANGDKTQQWAIQNDGTIRNQGYCLDEQYNNTKARTRAWVYKCNGTSAQQWKLTNKGEIINTHSNLCLDDQWAKTNDGNTIWMWNCNGTNAQAWTVPTNGGSPSPSPSPSPTPSPTPNPGNPGQPLGVSGNWKSIFDDEFNGNSVDTSKWWPNWYGNKGTTPPDSTDDRTCYNPKQVVVHNGEADLNAVKGGCKGHGRTYHYTSGILQSYGKFEFTYGFMEARIWVPAGKGVWPAWWMINDNGEIDILEAYGDNVATFNYHGGVEHGGEKKITNATGGWHTYAANWEKGKVTWYYDGQEVGHVTSTKISTHKMPLILNLEIGPKDSAASNAKVPSTMKIDYVRVWQKK